MVMVRRLATSELSDLLYTTDLFRLVERVSLKLKFTQ